MRKIIRANWHRLITYLCFVTFGVWTLLSPLGSQSDSPKVFAVLFSLELTIAGLCLIISVFSSRFWFFVAGYVVYALDMFTIGSLILWRSHSPVGILVLGFGFQAILNLIHVKRERASNAKLVQLATQLAERRKENDN